MKGKVTFHNCQTTDGLNEPESQRGPQLGPTFTLYQNLNKGRAHGSHSVKLSAHFPVHMYTIGWGRHSILGGFILMYSTCNGALKKGLQK